MRRILVCLAAVALGGCLSDKTPGTGHSSGTTSSTHGSSSSASSGTSGTTSAASSSASSTASSSSSTSSTSSSSTTTSSTSSSSTTSSSTSSSSSTTASSTTTGSSGSTTTSTTTASSTTGASSSTTGGTTGSSGGLLFTEYVEGSSSNKALELSNLGSAPVDLSGYQINIYFNHGTTPSSVSLSGILAVGSSFVICNPNATFASSCQATSGRINFNGDDGVQLVELASGNTVDRIGDSVLTSGIWGTGSVTTQDHTLRRKCGITSGDTDFSAPFDPSVEWDGLPVDDISGLGSPACLGGSSSSSGSTSSSTSGTTGSTGGSSSGSTGSSGTPAPPPLRYGGIETYSWDEVSVDSALGDFDGDGVPDAVVLRGTSLLVLHGVGDGRFARRSTISLGVSGPGKRILAADLNHDTQLDLVVGADTGTGILAVSVYLGNGDGTFKSPAAVTTSSAVELAIADVNGDTKPDLVTIAYDSGTHARDILTTYLGNGDGTFGVGSSREIWGGWDGVALQIGDVSGDTKPDVLVLSVSSSLNEHSVFEFDGDGTGAFPTAVGTGVGSTGLASALLLLDVDQDTDLDLVVSSDTGVDTFTNSGIGVFSAGVHVSDAPARYLAAGDLNGGFVDLITADDFAVSVFPGTGGGGFGPASALALSQSVYGSWGGRLQVADLDGDGALDLALTNAEFAVYLNAGSGQLVQALQLDAGADSQGVAVADLDRDGKLDLISASSIDQRLTVYYGDGDGGFPRSAAIDMHLADGGALVGRFVPLEADGGELRLLTTNGATLYTTFLAPDGGYRVAAQVLSRTVGTLYPGLINADALPDLASFVDNSGDLLILLGLPDAGFAEQPLTTFGLGNVQDLKIVDLNGDGLGDLVLASGAGSQGYLGTRMGEPDGGLASPAWLYVNGSTPRALAMGDFNGDGVTDAVASAEQFSTFGLLYFEGLGDGGFGGPALQLGLGLVDTNQLTAVDLDGNGTLDVVANDGLARAALLLGDGTGHFDEQAFLIGDGFINYGVATGIAIGDLNGDGKPDLVFGDNINGNTPARPLTVLISR